MDVTPDITETERIHVGTIFQDMNRYQEASSFCRLGIDEAGPKTCSCDDVRDGRQPPIFAVIRRYEPRSKVANSDSWKQQSRKTACVYQSQPLAAPEHQSLRDIRNFSPADEYITIQHNRKTQADIPTALLIAASSAARFGFVSGWRAPAFNMADWLSALALTESDDGDGGVPTVIRPEASIPFIFGMLISITTTDGSNRSTSGNSLPSPFPLDQLDVPSILPIRPATLSNR